MGDALIFRCSLLRCARNGEVEFCLFKQNSCAPLNCPSRILVQSETNCAARLVGPGVVSHQPNSIQREGVVQKRFSIEGSIELSEWLHSFLDKIIDDVVTELV